MNKIKSTLIVAAVVLGALPLLAQPKPRVSPQETITADVDGNSLKLVYSRPYSKDPKSGEIRKIWGKLVPYGKVWRTGANEATLLTTSQPIVLGGTEIPAGTYSLFTVPNEDGTAKLIINKRTGQWGVPYDETKEAANELARVDLKKDALDKDVDQFSSPKSVATVAPSDQAGRDDHLNGPAAHEIKPFVQRT
jgi:hypothetical protein